MLQLKWKDVIIGGLLILLVFVGIIGYVRLSTQVQVMQVFNQLNANTQAIQAIGQELQKLNAPVAK
jgi:hypothetical protein